MGSPAGNRFGSEVGNDSRTVVKRAPGRAERLLAEARHLAAVAGPGVVPLEGLVSAGGEVELHLERAEGSVADALSERGPLPEPEVRAVGVAAARALARLHDAGLVHADVKPANLLLTADGELWLADLDATVVADGRPLDRGSPGRRRADATADPTTDVVALGVALVELATGVIPDPSVDWSRASLAGLDCPPALAGDLEPVLGSQPSPSARELADALDRAGELSLPRPALIRGVDPTPTVDFDPVVVTPDIREDRTDHLGSPTRLLGALAALVLVVVIGLALV